MLNQPNYFMSQQAFVIHWERIQACQARLSGLTIRLGLKWIITQGREQEIAGILHDYEELLRRPFDLVLGSIHELNGVFFSNKHQAPHCTRIGTWSHCIASISSLRLRQSEAGCSILWRTRPDQEVYK